MRMQAQLAVIRQDHKHLKKLSPNGRTLFLSLPDHELVRFAGLFFIQRFLALPRLASRTRKPV